MRRGFCILPLLLLMQCGNNDTPGGETGGGPEFSQDGTHADFTPSPEQRPMPTPALKAQRTDITHAQYPAMDIHFHAGEWYAAGEQ